MRRALLKDAPSLHTPTLGLGGDWIGVTGGQAFAAMKDAPSVDTLTLDLRRNSIGDGGAQTEECTPNARACALSQLYFNSSQWRTGRCCANWSSAVCLIAIVIRNSSVQPPSKFAKVEVQEAVCYLLLCRAMDGHG